MAAIISRYTINYIAYLRTLNNALQATKRYRQLRYTYIQTVEKVCGKNYSTCSTEIKSLRLLTFKTIWIMWCFFISRYKAKSYIDNVPYFRMG